MRIRLLALVFMSSLGLLSLASALMAWSDGWARVVSVRESERLVRVMQPAVEFVEGLALERGVYNQVLVSKETGLEESRRLVAEQVQVTDRLFDTALTRSDALPAPLASRVRSHFLKARDIVRKSRNEADQLWMYGRRTSSEDAAKLVRQFVDAKSEIDEALAISSRALASHDASLGLMLEVSMLSNELREMAGRRSTMLSRYAATRRAFDLADRVAVSQDTGSIRTTWERLQRIARQIGSPEIDVVVERVRSDFFDKGEPIYISMANAARDGLAPPLTFLQWRKWTVETLTKTLAARDAPIRQALMQLDAMRADVLWRFYMGLAGFGGVLLIVVVAGVIVEVRIVRPLSYLTKEIDHLVANPKSSLETSPNASALERSHVERRDEIGSLARALTRLSDYAKELFVLNERFDGVLANLPQGVCFYEHDNTLVIANSKYSELYGLAPERCRAGASLAEVLCLRSASGHGAVDVDGDAAVARWVSSGAGVHQQIVPLRNGRTLSVVGVPMPRGGWLATHTDITEATRAIEQIAHMATHDALTGLPNRNYFHAELSRIVSGLQPGGEVAVMCLDLDRFKFVNDTLGHACGDELLKQVAERLANCVRPTDLVARLGGDEFAIVLEGTGISVTDIGQRIVETVSIPFQLTDHQAVVGTSIGVAKGPEDGAGASDLLKAADMALYRAKADGRGVVRFFEAGMDERMQNRRLLEIGLRNALINDEFELLYQPLLDLERDEISGFEALLRWNHPALGQVAPSDFIPLAEETGLIHEIGAWALNRACVDAVSWPKSVRVAVNLSPVQFLSTRLALDVTSALMSSGLSPKRLEIEITERVMLTNTESTLDTLHKIRHLGVRIAMDDFGTGYSSLSYLRKFPFDKIKIDQSFVQDIDTAPDLVSIVRAVASLGAGLGISTTAEGVETKGQLEAVRAEGCTEVQGYLISPPVAHAQVPNLLAQRVSYVAA